MQSLKLHIVLIMVFALFLAACGADAASDDSETNVDTTTENTQVTESADNTDSEETTTDETAEDNTETESDSVTDADSFVNVTGEGMEDLSLEVFAGGDDYSPMSNFYDESAFRITMTPIESGEFFPATSIVGIPRDAQVGTAIPLGYAQTGVACLTYQPEISGTTALTSVSGELILIDYDGETASGTFEAVVSDEFITCTLSPTDIEGASGEGTITVSGQFTAVSIPTSTK